LVTFNTMMEEKFNQEMQLKRYHMTIPLYVRTDNYDGNISLDEMRDFCRGTLGADKEDRRSTKNLRDIYENYYFGRPAGEVENPLDLTMYR